MIYLTYSDFYAQIRKDILEDIAEGDDIDGSNTPKIDTAEMAAVSESQAYLRSSYNITSEYAKTGTARISVLVMWVVDMTVYHLYAASNLAQIPIDRVDRYNNAIKGLTNLQTGKLDIGLEYVEDEGTNDDGSTLSSSGSNCKQSHEY